MRRENMNAMARRIPTAIPGESVRRFAGHRSSDGRSGLLSIGRSNRADKSIAATRKRLNVPRLFGIVRECGADLLHAKVDTKLEIHKSVVTPQTPPNFFAAHDLPGLLDKQSEHAERLRLNLQRDAGFAEFAACGVQLESAESNHRGNRGR